MQKLAIVNATADTVTEWKFWVQTAALHVRTYSVLLMAANFPKTVDHKDCSSLKMVEIFSSAILAPPTRL
jgi:hypothetical protein